MTGSGVIRHFVFDRAADCAVATALQPVPWGTAHRPGSRHYPFIEQRTRWSRRSKQKGDTAMNTEIQNADIQGTSALTDAELDCVIGGKATYYEMNGHWYIVGHDKHGHSTGAVQVS
jgi:hypothetical protein